MWYYGWLIFFTMTTYCSCSNILLFTNAGTKSHTIPLLALAQELIARNHSVTLLSPFKCDQAIIPGLEEINPPGVVSYMKEFNDIDMAGARMKGKEPLPFYDYLRLPIEICDVLYNDQETKNFLASGRKFDLLILDSLMTECAMGIVHVMKMPFMYLNVAATVSWELSIAGNPTPYSVTPFAIWSFTDTMNFIERVQNVAFWSLGMVFYEIVENRVRNVLYKHFPDIPDSRNMIKNVNFILQNGHYSISYPRAYLPNVVEIGCIQCKPAKALNKELEDFINSGKKNGFVLFSLGSSVKTANIPEKLKLLLVNVFARLPFNVLWKWDTAWNASYDLPSNVMVNKWLPQQDILGHKNIRAFVSHSGLLSTLETVYHGVPIVTIPVFADQDLNAVKSVSDGYGLKIELYGLTSELLYNSIMRVATDPSFRQNVKRRQKFLKDNINTPMEKAIFWVEYVLRHKGAPAFITPATTYNFFQYFSIDVYAFLFVCTLTTLWIAKYIAKQIFQYFFKCNTPLRKYKKK